MKFLYIVIILLTLQGCYTKYMVETTHPDGKNVKVSVWSAAKDYTAPNLHYRRMSDDVQFDFTADTMNDKTADPYWMILQGLLNGTIQTPPRQQ